MSGILTLSALIAASTCLVPYGWLVGPPRDVFWRNWLPWVSAPLFVLYWPGLRKRLGVLGCCVAYWTALSLLTNLQFYSRSSTQFCLAYHSEGPRTFLVGPVVSGCEAVTRANVAFDPPAQIIGWRSMNDFDVLVLANWTLMTVSCRGRKFPACDHVPSETHNLTDWRTNVPWVPVYSVPGVCLLLLAHVLVFLGVGLKDSRAAETTLNLPLRSRASEQSWARDPSSPP